jgi:hypothetical protein
MSDIKKFLDQEGVKYLWSKINMQDYPNNETLMAVINAIDETKADKSELEKIPSTNIFHNNEDVLLSSLIEQYILNIDYLTNLAFDTSEIVIGINTNSKSALLGTAILGSMKLGYK